VGVVYLLSFIVTTSPFGRVLKAIREDDLFACTLAKHTLYFKVSIFIASTVIAATAGCLYAHYITYIDPTSFTVMESILMLSMVIIGGAGTLWGPMAGAIILVMLPEALRFLNLPSAIAANMRQIIYGLALVACMLWRPQGLIGEYAFGREGKRK
jgi:branched-chain amino acid transport system permease protein